MGKKKGQQQHATSSFNQLVGKANQEALKPFILSVIGDVGNDISRRVFGKMAIMQNRLEALETVLKSKLDLTQSELDGELYDLEDRITGFKRADRPAEEGDLLRLTMRIKNVKSGYGRAQKKEFSNLGRPPFALGLPAIEKSLIGAYAGQTLIYPFDEELVKQTQTEEIEFTVERVSELIDKPKAEEPKKENTDAESQNAPESAGSQGSGESQA